MLYSLLCSSSGIPRDEPNYDSVHYQLLPTMFLDLVVTKLVKYRVTIPEQLAAIDRMNVA